MSTNQSRVSDDQSQRRSSRFNQSDPSSRHATRGIKGVCLHFSVFPTTTAVSIARNLSALRSVEHGKNTSVTSGVTFTNAISLRCNLGTFNGGATYRSRFNQSQRRGSRFNQSQRRSSRFNQSQRRSSRFNQSQRRSSRFNRS